MKNILIILSMLTLISASRLKENLDQRDYVCLMYRGASDKPIRSILVSKDSIDLDSFNRGFITAKNYLVNDGVYKKIRKTLFEYRKNVQTELDASVGFEIYIDDSKLYKYYIGRQKSIELLTILINDLKGEKNVNDVDDAIISTLDRFKKP